MCVDRQTEWVTGREEGGIGREEGGQGGREREIGGGKSERGRGGGCQGIFVYAIQGEQTAA